MTSLNPQQFEQLSMFMTANDVWDAGYIPKEGASAGRKLAAARSNGLRGSIAREGVQTPVALSFNPERTAGGSELLDRTLSNGHHRFFTQEELDPDRLMPVEHYEKHPQAVAGGALRELDAVDAGLHPGSWSDDTPATRDLMRQSLQAQYDRAMET